jgi:RimJ/RimL family protein N-acetyltransferase
MDTKKIYKKLKLTTGKEVILRKTRKEDLQKLVDMYTTLSEETLMFLRPYRFTPTEVREMQERVDWKRVFSLVAENSDKIIAEARLIRYSDSAAEFGIIVHDDYRNMKLGQNLVKMIIELARDVGVRRLIAFCTIDNKIALHIYKKLGFNVEKRLKAEKSVFDEKGFVRLAIDIRSISNQYPV